MMNSWVILFVVDITGNVVDIFGEVDDKMKNLLINLKMWSIKSDFRQYVHFLGNLKR